MVLMGVLGLMLLGGLALTAAWGGTAYRRWQPSTATGAAGCDGDPPPAKDMARRYLRGLAVALVGGFWTGLLVTGPAIRLIMRLLAATAGDDAQGAITEAEEVVGEISVGGTIGLMVFSGLLPGLLSGSLYVLIRRWLPQGRMGGVAFGLLHLVVAATRVDPLRPDNPDFDIVGPGWLSVATFALACVLHGMAIAAIANRYSAAFPPPAGDRRAWRRAVAPLVLPAALLVVGFVLLVGVLIGLVVAVAASRIPAVVRAFRTRAATVAGRVALAAVALAFLPGAVRDLYEVIVRP